MNKKIILSVGAILIIGGGLAATRVYAEETQPKFSPFENLAKVIAEKFGLNQNEVTTVINQNRQEQQKIRQTEQLAELQTKLTQLVTDGKITEAQKQLILSKHQEMTSKRQADMETFRSLSREEKRSLRDTQRSEMETWAKDNGIDLQYLMLDRGEGFGGGRGGRFGMGMNE